MVWKKYFAMCKLWPWPWRYVLESRSWYDCMIYYPDPTWQWGVMARTWISGICALWPWTRRYDNGSRSWHTLVSWTTIVWNIIEIQLGSEELWPGHGFPVYVHCDLELGDMTLGQGHDTTWVMDNNCVKYYPDPTWQWGVMAGTQIFSICALWPWPRRYDLRSRSWHTLGSWTTIAWNSIQIQLGSEELWPRHGFPVCVHCDLDLGDITLGQGHNTPLGHGQQLCNILSRSNLAVRSYGSDTDFQYVCTVTLTLEIWPWVKVMTHPWVMDNNCVKYYPDPTWQWRVMARTQISSICALWPCPWRYDLGSRSWHTIGSWTTIVWNIIQIQLGSGVMAGTRISSMCALWPWPWRYDLRSRSWHTLGSWTTIVWN